MNALIQDLRHAARTLRKAPGFTIAALMTLGLGIGATTAIFSLVNVALLEPPPYPDPQRLLVLSYAEGGSQDGQTFHYVRERVHSFEHLATMSHSSGWNLVVGDYAEYVAGVPVSEAFFETLGILPRLGRGFSRSEDSPGGPRALVVSDALWRHAFKARSDVVGEVVLLGGVPHTIVGVMPPGFRTFPAADVWTSLRLSPTDGTSNYTVLGRLQPGVSPAQAMSELEVLKSRMRNDLRGIAQKRTQAAQWMAYQRWQSRGSREELLLLLGAVGFLLLIACVNVASLQLVRAVARRHEMATRVALGGGAVRLIRQVLTESILLALTSGALGIAVAGAAMRTFVSMVPGNLLDGRQVEVDARALIVTLIVAMTAGIAFGLAPAMGVARLDIRTTLWDGGRNTAGRQTAVLRRLFAVAEIALAIVLLVGAGLLIRTFVNLRAQELGFDPSNVIVAKMSLQGSSQQTQEALATFFERTLARLNQVTGVTFAAVSNNVPVESGLNLDVRAPEGGIINRATAVDWRYVTPEYFSVFRIPLHAGRAFDDRDQGHNAPVAIVNDAFRRTYFGNVPVLGRTVHIAPGLGDAPRQIVGVVADVKGLSAAGWKQGFNALGSPAVPVIYVPVAQVPDKILQLVHRFTPTNWVVRTRSGADVIPALQDIVRSAEPRLPFMRFESMDQVIAHDLATQRFLMTLLTVFAAVALTLAAVGIYVLIAYSVAQRTREVGIRMAIGATHGRVVLVFMKEGFSLVVIGGMLGLGAAAFASRLLRAILFGIHPLDSVTFAAGAALLLAVTGLAVFVPALRAARVDPMIALRAD